MAEAGADNLNKFKEQGMTAFIVGYTGEVGKELVKALNRTQAFSRVLLVGRRKADLPEDLGDNFVRETK